MGGLTDVSISIERSPSRLQEMLASLQKIDRESFEKSDRLLPLTMDELTKKTNKLFVAKADGMVVAYLLYSHTKLEGYSRILKVSACWT